MPNGVYPGIAQHLNRRSGLDGRRLVASARFNWAGLVSRPLAAATRVALPFELNMVALVARLAAWVVANDAGSSGREWPSALQSLTRIM